MNYNRFCQHEAPIHSLFKREIEHPYLVLEDLCKKRTKEFFQHELDLILSIFFKEGGWKEHDPGILYETHTDLVRLIDALHLINKYSPALSSIKCIKGDEGKLTKMDDLNCIFRHRITKEMVTCAEEPQTVLAYFYNSCHIGFLKIDLNSCLQIVLDASYMPNTKYEYFGFDQSDFLINLHRLYDLISEAYAVYDRGRAVFPVLEGCPELAFAKDKNHPTYLLDECISKPMGVTDYYYDYYLSIEHMHKGLKAWKKILFVRDFWKGEENPGNLIYLHDCLATLIDVFWLANKKGLLEIISFSYSEICKEVRAVVKKCSKEERNSPLLVIRNFFAFKSMHEWKTVLDEWLGYSLSNVRSYTEDREKEVNRSFKYLIKFMEAAYLISHAKS